MKPNHQSQVNEETGCAKSANTKLATCDTQKLGAKDQWPSSAPKFCSQIFCAQTQHPSPVPKHSVQGLIPNFVPKLSVETWCQNSAAKLSTQILCPNFVPKLSTQGLCPKAVSKLPPKIRVPEATAQAERQKVILP